MIAVQVGFFEVLDDEFAVHEQSAKEPRSERLVAAGGGVRKKVKGPDPRNRTERDVHRTGPVHAQRERIGRKPVVGFRDEFGGITIVAGQPVGLAEPREMLAAAQFPRHFDVSRPIEFVVIDVGAVFERPLAAGLEIGEPRQPCTERRRPRPKQIEFVTGYRVGRLDDRSAILRITGRETPRHFPALTAGDEKRLPCQFVPQRIDVGRTQRRQHSTLADDARINP